MMCPLLLIPTVATLNLMISYLIVRLHFGLQYCGDLLCRANFWRPLRRQRLPWCVLLDPMPRVLSLSCLSASEISGSLQLDRWMVECSRTNSWSILHRLWMFCHGLGSCFHLQGWPI